MAGGHIEQTDNLPLVIARHGHARLQALQQSLRAVEALDQHSTWSDRAFGTSVRILSGGDGSLSQVVGVRSPANSSNERG